MRDLHGNRLTKQQAALLEQLFSTLDAARNDTEFKMDYDAVSSDILDLVEELAIAFGSVDRDEPKVFSLF